MIWLKNLLNIGINGNDDALNFAIKMFNIAALILAVSCAFYSIIFYSMGYQFLGIFIAVNSGLYFSSLMLSKKGFFLSARLILIHCFNLGAGFMVIAVGYDSGLSYLFFFIISASNFFIISKENWLRIYSIFLPLVLLLISIIFQDTFIALFSIPKILSMAMIFTISFFFICTEFFQFILHNGHIEELKQSREDAERLANIKGDFLSTISHEILTPINAIASMAHLMSDTTISKEDNKKYSQLLSTNCDHLLSIIENILDYSQIQDKQSIVLTLEKHLLIDTFKKLHNNFETKCTEKNLTLEVAIDPNLNNQSGYYDEKRFYQSLSYILDNAIKFTHEGHVKIDVKVISKLSNKTSINVCISDTGIGIDPSQIEALSKPFSQIDTSLTRKFSGIGMGLALSQKILKSMGSNLIIESELNKGSNLSFDFTLFTAKKSFNLKSINLSGKIGLLVEDNPVNIQIMKLLLAKWNMQLDIVNDGLQAVNLLKKQQSNYHIIFMDLHMPVMDGIESTQLIRSNNLFAGPIIAVSAETQAKIINSLPEKGFNDFLAKPISPKSLMNKLSKYL